MKQVLVFFISELSGVLIHSKVFINLKFLSTNVIDVSLLSQIYLSERTTGYKKCNSVSFTFKCVFSQKL